VERSSPRFRLSFAATWRGRENRTNLVFLHTTVDDGDYFQQILAWTLKSRWQKQNDQLREATNSFHSEK
jgi:hypothetical protein